MKKLNLDNQTRNDVVPYYAAVIRDDEARKALEADILAHWSASALAYIKSKANDVLRIKAVKSLKR